MSFKDISARMKARKGDESEEGAAPVSRKANPEESYKIRGKMLGVLLRDARVAAGRSTADLATTLNVAPEQIESWEYGDEVPSLPQLEILAYRLGVAVSHFWGQTTLESSGGSKSVAQDEYIALRNRMIGALLRQAREEAGLTLEAVSESSHVRLERLNAYEVGDVPVPTHELSVLAGIVKKNMSYFLETSSYIGELLAQKEEWRHFTALPEDLRKFAANPLNIGFLHIAILLAKMPSEQLRQVGTSILDITM